jgi:hypothetical protein
VEDVVGGFVGAGSFLPSFDDSPIVSIDPDVFAFA